MKKEMKSLLFVFLFSLSIISCGSDDNGNDNCNFLLNVGVNTSINLNLPQYSQLQFVSNSAYVPNVGNGGIVVTNTGTGFRAWDAADPNHTPSACSILSIEDGVIGKCNCNDENMYSFINGQPLNNPDLRCGLKSYVVEQNGSELIIFN